MKSESGGNLKIREFSKSQLRDLESRLRDRRGSRFLGHTEGLLESSVHDIETLRRVGRTPEDITAKVCALVDEYYSRKNIPGAKDIYEPESIGSDFIVRMVQFRGSIFCPFEIGCEGGSGARDFHILNATQNRELLFGEIFMHLIEDHHFFEGQVSNYRVDPLYAAVVLGLISEETYLSEKGRERLYDRDIDQKNLPRLLDRIFGLPIPKGDADTELIMETKGAFDALKAVLGDVVFGAKAEGDRSKLSDLVSALVSDIAIPSATARMMKMRVLLTLADVDPRIQELRESVPTLKAVDCAREEWLRAPLAQFFDALDRAERGLPPLSAGSHGNFFGIWNYC